MDVGMSMGMGMGGMDHGGGMGGMDKPMGH